MRITSRQILLLCSAALSLSLSVHAADIDSAPTQSGAQAEMSAARNAIQQQNWPLAVRELERAIKKDPKQAEAHTLMGFALRKSGQLDRAFASYDTALKLDPRSQGAHEYVGEAYLMAKQPAKAREHLATLKGLCGNETCEPYQDLAKAIAAYKP